MCVSLEWCDFVVYFRLVFDVCVCVCVRVCVFGVLYVFVIVFVVVFSMSCQCILCTYAVLRQFT